MLKDVGVACFRRTKESQNPDERGKAASCSSTAGAQAGDGVGNAPDTEGVPVGQSTTSDPTLPLGLNQPSPLPFLLSLLVSQVE
ncbi:hypothetical protein NDU88_006151 [Pleurodeles waltl]|uniref:Uncharacterized protein n=1 Tax=Pleurodeles waltl TaxID=8319 RepID=A0AAV7TDC5_PLEWA|nr:hypothetical protein NDU88_006151 [Pleurodeles waltl]